MLHCYTQRNKFWTVLFCEKISEECLHMYLHQQWKAIPTIYICIINYKNNIKNTIEWLFCSLVVVILLWFGEQNSLNNSYSRIEPEACVLFDSAESWRKPRSSRGQRLKLITTNTATTHRKRATKRQATPPRHSNTHTKKSS